MKQFIFAGAILALAAPSYAQLGGIGGALKKAQQAQDAKEKLDDLTFSDEEERQIGTDVSVKLRQRFGVVQDAAVAEFVEFGCHGIAADHWHRGDKVEAARFALGGGLEHQLQHRAITAVLGELVIKRQRQGRIGFLQCRPERVGDQAAAVLDSARHQFAHLPVGALELPVKYHRQSDEDADQHNQFQRQRCGDPAEW